jgi:P4 family phage/plasmid primase-like protien
MDFNEQKFRKLLPPEMLREKRFVRYFLQAKPEGGTAKIPLGNHSDSATWSRFDDAVTQLKENQGIGYCFLAGEVHGVDVDHCRNPKTGKLCNEAMLLLSRLQSWAEYSVSGQGIHVFFKGNVRGKQLTETCLQYWNPKNSPRFFALTCDMVGDAFSALKDVGDEFNYIFATARHISAKIREELQLVDPEQWAALPAEREPKAGPREKSRHSTRKLHPEFNLEDFLKFYDLQVDNVTKNDLGTCYRLTTCPIKGGPHVGQNSTSTNFILTKEGGLGFQCQSTGCADYSAKDVIEKLAADKDVYPNPIYEKPDDLALDFFSDGDLTTQFVASEPVLKYASDERIWFDYRQGIWRPKDTPKFEIEAFLRSIEPNNIDNPKSTVAIHRRLTSIRAVAAVRSLAEDRPQLKIKVQDFDPDPMLLGLPDGEVLDLRTGERRAATPYDLLTRSLPVAPAGSCPRWLHYLQETHPKDEELITYLQRWAGYCLTAWTKEDMILFLIGVGGSGKGTFAEPLQKLLGEYCVSIPIGMLLESTNEDRRLNYIASLRGARLAVCNEGSKIQRLDSRGIKMLTGGGWLTGRRLGHQPINFKATHKIVVLANDNPVLELDDAMKQRVHVVPFTQKFRGEQREEKGLREFFAEPEQLQGIFNWMLEGCLAYQTEGLRPPASVVTTTEQYFQDADLFEQFLQDRTYEGPSFFEATEILFREWSQYCELRGYKDKITIGTTTSFAGTLKNKRPQLKFGRISVAGGRARGFAGIKLLQDQPSF